MSTSHLVGLLILSAILVLLSFIFSASESAFLAINKLRLRVLRKKRDKKAQRTGALLDSKTKLLNTILIGNNIVNIAFTSVLTAIVLELFGAGAVEIAASIATVVLLLISEITPKTIASSAPEKVAFALSPIISVMMKIFSPFSKVFKFIAEQTARLVGINPKEKKVSFTEEEIKTFIDAGAEEGVLENDEKHLLRQVFKFADLSAKEIMVPRRDIVALSLDATFHEILSLAKKTTFSRFPVYKDDIDDICGILYIKDLLLADTDEKTFEVKKYLREPLFILENRRISTVRKIFKENKQTIALVIDEYSGTSGVITIEDLTRQIFGLMDGSMPDEKNVKHLQSAKEFFVDGSTRLLELSEELGITLESEFYDTIGGFIAEQCGAIPAVNTSVTVADYTFSVVSMDANRVERVRIARS